MTRRRTWDRGWWLLQRQRLQIADPEPPPSGGPVEIASVIDALAPDLRLDGTLLTELLESRWAEIVGPSLAGHCRPGPIVNRTLTIYVRHSILLHELSRDRALIPGLLEKLRKDFPFISWTGVRFDIDPGRPPGSPSG